MTRGRKNWGIEVKAAASVTEVDPIGWTTWRHF